MVVVLADAFVFLHGQPGRLRYHKVKFPNFFLRILIAPLSKFRRMETPIEGAEDLSKQTKIKYGTLGRGSTMSFFNVGSAPVLGQYKILLLRSQKSKLTNVCGSLCPPQIHLYLWRTVKKEFIVWRLDTCVSKEKCNAFCVQTQDYAYLMESSMLEYAVERDCELTQVSYGLFVLERNITALVEVVY